MANTSLPSLRIDNSFESSHVTNVRIRTLRWIAGAYYLILGASLLILTPAAFDRPEALSWLRGALTAASGLLLLWVAVVAMPRTIVCALHVLIALPQLLFGFTIIGQGSYAAGLTLIWFALGVLVAAAIRWRAGELTPTPLRSGTEQQLDTNRGADIWAPDLSGLVLAAAQITQGVDFILRPAARLAVPAQLGVSATAVGYLFVISGLGLAFAQILPRLRLTVRRAAHMFAGFVLLGLWLAIALFQDPAYWALGAAVVLRGVSTALLPRISNWAEQVDRRSLYPRMALALASASIIPSLSVAAFIVGSGYAGS